MSTRTTCSIEGCDRPEQARTVCTRHYQQHRSQGRLDELPPAFRNGNGRAADWTTVSCAGCGENFQRRAAHAAQSDRHFCSRTCYAGQHGRPRRGLVTTCEVCMSEFYVPQSQAHRRFCSTPCHDEHQRRNQVGRPCRVCGQEIRLRPSAAARTLCSVGCRAEAATRSGVGRRHNGKAVLQDGNGYLRVYAPGHSTAMSNGWAMEHRYVMAEALRRPLYAGENVHHKNGIRTDNRLENLELWVSSQPSGQRVPDLLAWADEIQRRYRDIDLTLSD